MRKANPTLDKYAHGFFYKKFDAQVLVKTRGGKIETHYYNISEGGRLEVYPKNNKNYKDNPVIKGSERPFNAQTKQLVFMWREGEAFAEPICNSEDFKGEIIRSQNDTELINWAFEFHDIINPYDKKQSYENVILVLIGIIALVVIANLAVTWLIAQHVGVELVTGGA